MPVQSTSSQEGPHPPAQAQQVCEEQVLQQHGTAGQAGDASQGGCAGLVVGLQSNVPSRQQQAATDIRGMTCSSQANRDAIIAAGAVPPLVALLRSDQPAVQQPAADALANLAAGSQQSIDTIVAAGAFACGFVEDRHASSASDSISRHL